MGQQKRDTLISYFRNGQRPTGENFKDLIDSMVNIQDDGISKSKNSAIKVAPSEESRDVIAILNESDSALPEWTISLEQSGDLYVCGKKGEGQPAAGILLKCNGDVELHGRDIIKKGSARQGETHIPADGKWHVIGEYGGITIIEITAAYVSNKGRGSSLVAWASHCAGRRRKIKRLRPFSFFWNNKIRLRWVRIKDAEGNIACRLEIKTRYNGGNNSCIKCCLGITPLFTKQEMK